MMDLPLCPSALNVRMLKYMPIVEEEMWKKTTRENMGHHFPSSSLFVFLEGDVRYHLEKDQLGVKYCEVAVNSMNHVRLL